jgi:fusaric acid resistance family protein
MPVYATRAYSRQARLTPPPDLVLARPAQRHDVSASVSPKPQLDLKRPVLKTNWVPWIFAAKTTASGLIALLAAFTFNLDQPYWALLTVFIVSQPQQGGQVLAGLSPT